jgi:hypothetical protein
MLLADQKPTTSNAYTSTGDSQANTGAYLRMARLYYDRYSWVLDWSNVHGKTALHMAALKGSEELVRVCSAHNFFSRPYLKNNLHLDAV